MLQMRTKFERITNTAKSAQPQRPKSSFLDPQQPNEEYKETKSLEATNPEIEPTCSLAPASLLGFVKLYLLNVYLQSLSFFLIASTTFSNLDIEEDL